VPFRRCDPPRVDIDGRVVDHGVDPADGVRLIRHATRLLGAAELERVGAGEHQVVQHAVPLGQHGPDPLSPVRHLDPEHPLDGDALSLGAGPDVPARVGRLLAPPEVPPWVPGACLAGAVLLVGMFALTQAIGGLALVAAAHHLLPLGTAAYCQTR
jgi:hypothetical protein